MNTTLLRIYHRLPARARSMTASLRGYYLRSWRYGPETEKLISDSVERECWSAARWRTWQEQRLSYVLHRAATQVPYYREYWSRRRRNGNQAAWDVLENWPVLKKETLRKTPQAFLANDCNRRRMFQESTSGTTGTPLDVWSSSETLRMWFALYESRIRRWNGTCRSEPWAILGGQPVVPTHVKRPPYWVWNAPMNQLYLSANHLSRRNAPAFIEGLNRYQVTHMVAYTSSAVLLAKFAMELGLQVPGLKVLMTNAESLFPWQRETIKRGLQCRVRETYGMAETVAAASECSAGRLHLWPEVGWLEVLPNSVDRTTRLTETGRLICTSLLNADMPLVRYELGDQVRLPAEAEIEPCSCGRKLPVIGGIEGRTNDVLIARDGRHVYWLNPVFYGLPVQQAQIIQETIDHIIVRFIPDNNFSPATVRTIVERVKASLGDVEVTLDAVDEIARSANGKFRAVVSRISADASTCMDVRA